MIYQMLEDYRVSEIKSNFIVDFRIGKNTSNSGPPHKPYYY